MAEILEEGPGEFDIAFAVQVTRAPWPVIWPNPYRARCAPHVVGSISSPVGGDSPRNLNLFLLRYDKVNMYVMSWGV